MDTVVQNAPVKFMMSKVVGSSMILSQIVDIGLSVVSTHILSNM